jgi:hypothetical protein
MVVARICLKMLDPSKPGKAQTPIFLRSLILAFRHHPSTRKRLRNDEGTLSEHLDFRNPSHTMPQVTLEKFKKDKEVATFMKHELVG